MSDAPPSDRVVERRARIEAALARARLALTVVLLPLVAVIACDVERPDRLALGALAGGAAALALLARAGRLSLEAVTRLRSRAWVRAVDLALWNALVVVLLLEGTLSMAARFVQHPLLTAPNARSRERIRNARFAPHAPLFGGRVNARGFHDGEWDAPKPAGRLRVAALGDSFAVGIVPLAENALTLLEARARARAGRDIEVLNLGVSGTSPVDYLAILGDEGLAHEPDAVLVCFFAGNDFEPIRAGSRLRGSNWRTWALVERGVRIARQRRLRAAEEAARAGAGTGTGAGTGAGTGTNGGRGEGGGPERLSHEGYLDLAAGIHAEALRTPLPPRMEERYAEAVEALRRIIALARPRPVAVAVFPSELAVSEALRAEVTAKRGVRAEDLDLDQPFRRLRDALAPDGVPVWDVRPALVAAEAARGSVYERDDSHWNAAGNAAAALALEGPLAAWVEGLAAGAGAAGPAK
jgi:hypothetical protein